MLHALAWIIIIILPQFLSGRYFGNNRFFTTWWFIVNTATYLVIFYVNYLILVPRFFFSDKRLLYFASAIILMVGVYYLTEVANDTFFRRLRNERMLELQQSQAADTLQLSSDQFSEDGRYIRSYDQGERSQNFNQSTRRYYRSSQDSTQDRRFLADSTESMAVNESRQSYGEPPPDDDGRGPGRPPSDQRRIFGLGNPFQIYNYVLTALFFTFFSLGLKFMERHAGIEKRQKELEKEKLDSELALLKNQISPHFFFNTLNNIYSLIAINVQDSQEAVLKLSKLMRYLLYESEQGHTKLGNEIGFMINYIDLMRLRMSDKVNLSVQFPEEYDSLTIPPLLFIPFIENAFKHGISYRETSFISISMAIGKEKLVFQCTNSVGKKSGNDDEQHSGIGLDNVTKRLNLLFPGKHVLKIEQTEKEFHVNLEIDIKLLKENDQNHSNR